MKTHLVKISILAVMAACAAEAQTATPLEANIPFDFVLGNKTLPAGQYLVSHDSHDQAVVILRSPEHQAAMVLGTNLTSAEVQRTGKLVFHRYGTQCFLTEVWEPGHDNGSKLPQTSQEREILAQHSVQPRVTIVALR